MNRLTTSSIEIILDELFEIATNSDYDEAIETMKSYLIGEGIIEEIPD